MSDISIAIVAYVIMACNGRLIGAAFCAYSAVHSERRMYTRKTSDPISVSTSIR